MVASQENMGRQSRLLVMPASAEVHNAMFHNYRSISVLPVFSLIYERHVYNGVYDYVHKHQILNDNQFGFRKGYSTEMALIVTLD